MQFFKSSLLQCGLLSMDLPRVHSLLSGIYPLWCVLPPRSAGAQLLHHCLDHWHSFSTDLGICRVVPLTYFHPSLLQSNCICTVSSVFTFLNTLRRGITTISSWPSLDQSHICLWTYQGLALLDIKEASGSFPQKPP